jgi:hypothetical protein
MEDVGNGPARNEFEFRMRMSTALVALVGLILALAYTLVVYNRASSTVVGAALPAATGLLSALILVFAFNRPTQITRSFAVDFIVEEASLLPIQIGDRPFPFQSLGLADEMRQLDPKIFDVPSGGNKLDLILPLYHEYLQKVLVDDVAAKQFSSWRTKTERFVGMTQWSPAPDAAAYNSKILDSEELELVFAKNRFAKVRTGLGKWALPPSTELQVKPPEFDTKLGDIGVIHLKNSLCDLFIRTRMSSAMVGLGKYTAIVGLSASEAQKRYWTLEYIVTIDASFSLFRMGDVNMDVIRDWANSIVDELVFSFDEDTVWKQTKDNFLLRSHFAQATPQTAPGPIRFLKSAPTPEPETAK